VSAVGGHRLFDGGEVGGVDGAFVRASGDEDDAGEGRGGGTEEGEELDGEEEAAVDVDSSQFVETLGGNLNRNTSARLTQNIQLLLKQI
jgi:hypothetical protein